MWRVFLSGVFCLPALILLFGGFNRDSAPRPRNLNATSDFTRPAVAAPTISLSLPHAQFSAEPALADPDTWFLAPAGDAADEPPQALSAVNESVVTPRAEPRSYAYAAQTAAPHGASTRRQGPSSLGTRPLGPGRVSRVASRREHPSLFSHRARSKLTAWLPGPNQDGGG
jgi:hypothetical protein